MGVSESSLVGVGIVFCPTVLSVLGDEGLGISPSISDTDLWRIVPDDIRVILPGGDWVEGVAAEIEEGGFRGVIVPLNDIGVSIMLPAVLGKPAADWVVDWVSIRMTGLRTVDGRELSPTGDLGVEFD